MIKESKQRWLILTLLLVLFHFGNAASETKLLRHPDIHGDRLVFCYGGNLYTSAVDGKRVKQLTSFPGEECWPKFSPDGKHIAFTAEFEGNTDVYVMPVEGGKPRRLTFHPSKDFVVDWRPDGKTILFRSVRSSFSYRFNRLHEVPASGGLPRVLDLPEAELAGYDRSGGKIAFCRTSLEEMPHWKRYRGGMAPNIWTYDFKRRKAEPVIIGDSIDHFPMWMGDSIYFLSDRGKNKERNLWVFDAKSKKIRQITFHKDWEIKYAAKGERRIVYESGGTLYVHDTGNGSTRALKIKIDLPGNHLAPEVKNVKNRLGSITISPDGKAVVLSARGDLFYVEPNKKKTRNLTGTPGIKEKYPSWSPDGRYLAYISDATGEEQLYVREINGQGNTVRRMTGSKETRFGVPRWSPDSKKIGFSNHRSTYFFVDLDTRETRQVFFNKNHGSERFESASWSPDSKWLAFSLYNRSYMGAICLYSLETGKTHPVTGGFTYDDYPRFDPEGRYLFWINGHEVEVKNTYWDSSHHMVNPSRIIAATLRKDLHAPFSRPHEAGARVKDKGKPGAAGPLRIDLEGLGDRITALPVKKARLRYLKAIKGKLIYYAEPLGGEGALTIFDMASKKESVLVKDAWYCVPAANANKMAYKSWNNMGLVDIKPGQKSGDGQLDFSQLNATVDYKKAWRHIFHDAWRIQRDHFWDTSLNGVDWLAIRKKYETLLPYVASRKDLNHLIERMYAELGHSHVEISGGDMPKLPKENTGVLGIDLEWDSKHRRYRITKIYRGQNWNPSRISPLTLPGMNVKAGDYLLAIDGVELEKGVNPYSLLVHKAGKAVSLTVHAKPVFRGSRKVEVEPVPLGYKGRNFLRYNDWVLSNIEKVDKASNGKIGYIHIPNTYYEGMESFFRYFHPQLHKQALIVDVRFNSGGFSPHWMVERLSRKLNYRRLLPHGKGSMKEPDPGFFGPVVCISNQWAESGGDMFVDTFRRMGTGVIVGKRTAGSLSSTGASRLLDGGIVINPATGPPVQNGKTFIENIGVAPDIEVTNRPGGMIKGKDAQLERSIKELMKKLKTKGTMHH